MKRALLVIGLQNYSFPGGLMPAHGSEEMERKIISVIGRARTLGDRVILLRHVSRELTGQFPEDGWNAAMRGPVLAAAGDAPVLDKHFADGFRDSDLASHLDGIEELLICGMMSQNGVLFTAMSAEAAAYKVSVIGDLCAAPKPYIHRLALKTLEGIIPVRSAEDVYPRAQPERPVRIAQAPQPMAFNMAARPI